MIYVSMLCLGFANIKRNARNNTLKRNVKILDGAKALKHAGKDTLKSATGLTLASADMKMDVLINMRLQQIIQKKVRLMIK